MAVRDRETEWRRVQLYRQMTPAERIEAAARMFEDAILIVRSSILDREPGISAEDLERRIRQRVLPRGLASHTEQRSHGQHRA